MDSINIMTNLPQKIKKIELNSRFEEMIFDFTNPKTYNSILEELNEILQKNQLIDEY